MGVRVAIIYRHDSVRQATIQIRSRCVCSRCDITHVSQYPVRTLHIKLHKCPKFICQANPAMVSLVIWLSSELRVTCLARRSTLLFHAIALAFPSSEILQRLHNPRMRKRLPLSSVPKVVYLRGLNAYRKRAFNGF